MIGLLRTVYLLILAALLCGPLGCSSERSASTDAAHVTPAADTDIAVPSPAQPDPAGISQDNESSIQAQIVERINAIDVILDDLRTRIEDSASAISERIPSVESIEAAIAPRIAALQAGQETLAEQLATLETKLSKPQPAKAVPDPKTTAKPKPRKVKAPSPPFDLEAVETWDGTPQAVLNVGGHLVTVYEGDTRSGWRINAIHYPNRITVFHERTGRKRELRCNG